MEGTLAVSIPAVGLAGMCRYLLGEAVDGAGRLYLCMSR
jgi:hypothetical protein